MKYWYVVIAILVTLGVFYDYPRLVQEEKEKFGAWSYVLNFPGVRVWRNFSDFCQDPSPKMALMMYRDSSGLLLPAGAGMVPLVKCIEIKGCRKHLPFIGEKNE